MCGSEHWLLLFEKKTTINSMQKKNEQLIFDGYIQFFWPKMCPHGIRSSCFHSDFITRILKTKYSVSLHYSFKNSVSRKVFEIQT